MSPSVLALAERSGRPEQRSTRFHPGGPWIGVLPGTIMSSEALPGGRRHEVKGRTMSKKELEQIDDQGMAAWDKQDPDAFIDLFADEFVWRDLTVPEEMRTPDQAKAYMQGWFTAFPDMRVRTTNLVIGEDSLAAEIEFTGTNTGPLSMGGMEMPATGKSVVGKGAYFARVQGGKVVEFSSHPDAAGLMMQLGLMPGA
jgi:steroid delta-isomerase-like uncharacterized protein